MARTGTIEPFKRADGTVYYRAKITLADGSRVRVDVPKKYSYSRERADLYAAAVQERENKTGELMKARDAKRAEADQARAVEAAVPSETCNEYYKRLAANRESEGVRDVRKERTIWNKWIAPTIGARPIANVTRDEVETIRDALDAQVKLRIAHGLEQGISGATAENVWSVLRTTFKEARGSRDRTLRVRADDPTEGHKPPLKTVTRQKTFLYPTELQKLLSCERVPLEWREVYAVAVYLYVRPEELQALVWSDVDFDAGVVHVTKAFDPRKKKPKPLPKTANAVRDVPIHDSLMPLLRDMHERRASNDASILPVLHKLDDRFRAKQIREHLKLAGCTRARLYENTATLRIVDFRSCRDSGITWLALAGVQLAAMQRRAGHTEISQTLHYVKMAEDLGGKVGVPFAPLSLSSESVQDATVQKVSKLGATSQKHREKGCRRRESNGLGSADLAQTRDKLRSKTRTPAAVTPREQVTESPSSDLDSELAQTLRWAREIGDVELAKETLRADRKRREALERAELITDVLGKDT